MMKNLNIFLVITPLVFLLTAQNVVACSYRYIPSIYQTYKNASVVLIGKVVKSRGVGDKRSFQFEIEKTYKGLDKSGKKEIEIFNEENMCEGGFTIGESYLIYAYENSKDKFYTYNFATRNANLADAQDQIYFLSELLKGKRESQIYGSVVRSNSNPIINQDRTTNLQNIKVKVEGNGKTFEALTDINGIFYFNKIPKGKYTISPILPETYKSSYPSEESFFVLSSGRVVTGANVEMFLNSPEFEKEIENDLHLQGQLSDGAYFNFSSRWNNEVKGKILDAEGNEIFANVELVPFSNPFLKITDESSYRKGEYSSAGLTPENYYLVAEIYAPMAGKDKIRYFYPQADKPIDANIINIKGADKLEFDWQIPLVKRAIEGKVYWSDETPIIGDVRVLLSKSEHFDGELGEYNYGITRLDGASYFSLNGYVGIEYWVQTYVDAETYVDGKMRKTEIKAKPVKIKVERINKPLKILIPKPDK